MDDDGNTVDLSFLPETYKGEDDSYDTEKFRADYDELVSFKAQSDEAAASLPTEASAYAFALGEDHAWPEGFNPEEMSHVDADGNEIAFDPASIINAEDPDIARLQETLLANKADPKLASEIAGIFANREVARLMKANEVKDDEIKALGPEGESRLNTVAHAIKARVSEAQAGAILDGITSADALRGLEALLKPGKANPNPAPGKKDYSSMSIEDRILEGLKLRNSA